MEFGQKAIREIDLFDFMSFLAWTFLKFLAPTVNYKMHLGNFGAPHIHTMLKNSCSAKLHTTLLTLQTLYLFFYVFVQILIYSFFKDFKRKTKAKKSRQLSLISFNFKLYIFLYSHNIILFFDFEGGKCFTLL